MKKKQIESPAINLNEVYEKGRITFKTVFSLKELVKGEPYIINKVEAEAGMKESPYYLADICISIDCLVDSYTVILKTTGTLIKR